jgi:hypothetical protein
MCVCNDLIGWWSSARRQQRQRQRKEGREGGREREREGGRVRERQIDRESESARERERESETEEERGEWWGGGEEDLCSDAVSIESEFCEGGIDLKSVA